MRGYYADKRETATRESSGTRGSQECGELCEIIGQLKERVETPDSFGRHLLVSV